MGTLFPPAEYDRRLKEVRGELARRGLPLALVTSPDNIFYMTGLDHWGYFAPHVLIVPLEGELVLVTRAMEKVTIGNQVHHARFAGHTDSETAADAVIRELRAAGAPDRIGIEKWSSGLTPGAAGALAEALPATGWTDISGLVDEVRLIKSAPEQDYLRQAARVTDAAAAAGIEAIHAGVSEAEIAAACLAVMTREGTYPGFGPFIRSTARLGEEHTSWTKNALGTGDAVFFELSGCVARYHAPLGRLVHVGAAPTGTTWQPSRATRSTRWWRRSATACSPATSMPPGSMSSMRGDWRTTSATIAATSSASACRRAGPAAIMCSGCVATATASSAPA